MAYRSENCDAIAIFDQKNGCMAARSNEKLHLTSFQPKGQKADERETFLRGSYTPVSVP